MKARNKQVQAGSKGSKEDKQREMRHGLGVTRKNGYTWKQKENGGESECETAKIADSENERERESERK